MRDTYVANGQVRYVWHDFAFLGPESVWAAEAAACAHDQGRFWDYHDKLFQEQGEENSGAFSPQNLERFAAELGLDTALFDRDLTSNRFLPFVEQERQAGDANGINSTPTIFVNGRKLQGVPSWEVLQQAIDGMTRTA